jgi:glycosyltransferase involved in cell wall biosynthesis
MEKPWLSVIVPCLNGERWIAGALQSLVDQKEPGIEVLVVDGSANDTGLRIVDSFSDKLNIRAHHRPDLVPYTAATNFGVEQATSDRICILHVDDIWLPNRAAKLREWLAVQSDGVMHLHPSYIIDGSGRRLGVWRCPFPVGPSPVPIPMLFERLLVQNFISTPALTIRRDVYLNTGGLDNQLWFTADWDLYFKIASVGNVYYHSCPLACYRVHKNALTVRGSRNIEDFRKQYEIVFNRHIGKLSPVQAKKILPLAMASIGVNTALAAAINGELGQLAKALIAVLALGPQEMHRYFVYSRITERAFPRLRALVTRNF